MEYTFEDHAKIHSEHTLLSNIFAPFLRYLEQLCEQALIWCDSYAIHTHQNVHPGSLWTVLTMVNKLQAVA